ncbi:hypothetical protein CpPA04_1266 [Corynebacterium pseudotuberculosis]|nr:hypothetical protein CpPA04_1266 [Corynebacterium pseudotuberculosis]ATQ65588.1 Hypothetical protein CpPA07_1285 [Corynebacterium pseudotuberculosis]
MIVRWAGEPWICWITEETVEEVEVSPLMSWVAKLEEK